METAHKPRTATTAMIIRIVIYIKYLEFGAKVVKFAEKMR